MRSHAKEHGYAVVTGRSWRGRDREINMRSLVCAKAGTARDRVIDRKKPLISQKTECPFECKAIANKENGWELKVKFSIHNHLLVDSIFHHQH
jgi:hypothetical protein